MKIKTNSMSNNRKKIKIYRSLLPLAWLYGAGVRLRVRPLFRCRLRTFSSPACWFAWQPPIGQRTRGQPVGTHHPGRCPSALLSGLDNAIRLPRAPFRWWMRRQDTCFLSSFAGSRLTPGVRAWPPPGEWPEGGPGAGTAAGRGHWARSLSSSSATPER